MQRLAPLPKVIQQHKTSIVQHIQLPIFFYFPKKTRPFNFVVEIIQFSRLTLLIDRHLMIGNSIVAAAAAAAAICI
jgi:hypothetical protein